MASLVVSGCDDPIPEGPIGGIIMMIHTEAAPSDSRFAEVERITLRYQRVEARHSDTIDGDVEPVTLDTQLRTIDLFQVDGDVFVAQFQVPVGYVHQLRFHPESVTLHLAGGRSVALGPEAPELPSWRNTGLKVVPFDDEPFAITDNELTGVRAFLRFEDRMVRQGSPDEAARAWKLKPTWEAEAFQPNPDDEPGVFVDQLTVAFAPGTTRAEVDAINAEVGASVRIAPRLSTWYRIKLPASLNIEEGIPHYRAQPSVVAVLPGTNFGTLQLDTDDDDTNLDQYDVTRVREAWEDAANATGFVGSHAVEVGIIDGGFDIGHRDLYRNIGINQGELPLGLFDTDASGAVEAAEVAAFDCDPPGAPDGVISIRDLECGPAAIQPPDTNGNGRIDGLDLIADPSWADGVDDDDFDGDPTTFVDDLVGWNFFLNINDPTGSGSHGTSVAGVIGAEGDNGLDTAGVNWRVSIVPMVASPLASREDFTPDVTWSDAVTYVEERGGIDVVNNSQGWHYARDGADFGCGAKERQTTSGIPGGDFEDGVDEALEAYGALFSGGTSSTLYAIAAGNSGFDLDRDGILVAPAEVLRAVLPNNALAVGATDTRTSMAGFTNYGETVVNVYAAGVDWTALEPGDGTDVVSGTSFASPSVAGSAALLAAVTPGFRDNGAALHQAVLASTDAVVDPVCRDAGFTDEPVLNTRTLLTQVP